MKQIISFSRRTDGPAFYFDRLEKAIEEEVIDAPATVDIGMMMGTGFPPFRAGLLHYADSVGLDNIAADLKRFQDEVSAERFEPSKYLLDLAKKKAGFHSQSAGEKE